MSDTNQCQIFQRKVEIAIRKTLAVVELTNIAQFKFKQKEEHLVPSQLLIS